MGIESARPAPAFRSRAARRPPAGSVAITIANSSCGRIGQTHPFQFGDHHPAQLPLPGGRRITHRPLRAPSCRRARSAKIVQATDRDSSQISLCSICRLSCPIGYLRRPARILVGYRSQPAANCPRSKLRPVQFSQKRKCPDSTAGLFCLRYRKRRRRGAGFAAAISGRDARAGRGGRAVSGRVDGQERQRFHSLHVSDSDDGGGRQGCRRFSAARSGRARRAAISAARDRGKFLARLGSLSPADAGELQRPDVRHSAVGTGGVSLRH